MEKYLENYYNFRYTEFSISEKLNVCISKDRISIELPINKGWIYAFIA